MQDTKTKIYTACSPRSQQGMERIKELISESFEFEDIIPDILASGQVADKNRYILAHNCVRVHSSLRGKTIIYALQTVRNHYRDKPDLRVDMLKNPPLNICTNTVCLAQSLRDMGFRAEHLYRPSKIEWPAAPAPLPLKPKILWYWSEHPQVFPYREVVAGLMKELPDIDIMTFPGAEAPADLANVKALGRINMDEMVPQVDGLVRVGDEGDYGRSTFDFLAHGRWALYANMPLEEYSLNAPPQKLPEKIRELIKNRSNDDVKARFEGFYKEFSERALKERWLKYMQSIVFGAH